MSQTDDIDDSAAPLIEHLAELRTRLIRAVLAFLVAICLFFIPINGEFIAAHVLEFLLDPIENTLRNLGDPSPTFQYTSPQEYLFTLFRVSMVGGLAIAFPVLGLGIWLGSRRFNATSPDGFRRFAIILLLALATLGLMRALV